MKKNIFSLLTALFIYGAAFSQFGQTMTADQLINNHFIALGGKTNLESIKTAKLDLGMVSNGMASENSIWITDSGKYKLSTEANGQSMSVIVDGAKAWQITKDTAVAIPDNQVQMAIGQIGYIYEIFKSPLLGYDPETIVAEYNGPENKFGSEYNVLTIANKQTPDQKTSLYLNPMTNYVEYVSTNTPQGKIELEFKDFKKFGNLMFPTVVVNKVNGIPQVTFNVKSMDVNPDFKDGVFALPKG